MKSQGKLTRIKLDDSRGEDILIVGIVSAEPDYKLSLFINRKTGISLRSVAPLIIPSEEKELTFSVFSFSDEENEVVYNLVANRSDTGVLLKNPRNIDFILTVSGEGKEDDELIKTLRETESVTGVFRLNASVDRNIQFILSL